MDERPADADTPDHAQARVDPEPIEPHDPQDSLEAPEYIEADLAEPPIDPDTDDYVDMPPDEEAVTSLEQIDYSELPPDVEAPAFDLEPPEYVEAATEEPPIDLDLPDGGAMHIDEEAPTSLEQIDYSDLPSVEADAEDYSEEVDLEPLAPAELPPEAEIPGFPATPLATEAPGSAALYQAFVPRRMRRDRVAAMSYPSAIEMVTRQRRKGDPAALGELDMSDEEIAAAIQDYARGVDTEEERTNWLLGQILEEQQRQSRHLRGVKTVLILLIVAMTLAAIAACILAFAQLPAWMQ